jgi:hypothetical protein
VEADKLQDIDRTEPIIAASYSDEATTSVAESLDQTVASATISASDLPGLYEAASAIVDISTFTTTKIVNQRAGPSRVEYLCKFEPQWLVADLVEKAKMGRTHIQRYKNELIREERLGTLRDRKRKRAQM